MWWAVFAINLSKFKTIPIDIKSSYSYKCIISEPNPTKPSDWNKTKLPIDKESYIKIQELWNGGWKDKNGVYFCFWTKKLKKANPKTFQTITLINTGSYRAPFIFKDDKQVYIKTESIYLWANGTSYETIKTYPKLDATNFSCFLKIDSWIYCKNNKKIYIIWTSSNPSHTSNITISKLYDTNLDGSLVTIDLTTNKITYNNKPFETITNQFYKLSDTGEKINNPLNIQESTYTIKFK
jgi:hypothetical protein